MVHLDFLDCLPTSRANGSQRMPTTRAANAHCFDDQRRLLDLQIHCPGAIFLPQHPGETSRTRQSRSGWSDGGRIVEPWKCPLKWYHDESGQQVSADAGLSAVLVPTCFLSELLNLALVLFEFRTRRIGGKPSSMQHSFGISEIGQKFRAPKRNNFITGKGPLTISRRRTP